MFTKRCPKCHMDKPSESYSRDTKQANGLFYCCKECFKTIYKSKYKGRPKVRPPRPRNPELLNQAIPDFDEVFHCCMVKASDELSVLTMKKDLSNHDVGKMKALMEILLVWKKKARPIHDRDPQENPVDMMTNMFKDEPKGEDK